MRGTFLHAVSDACKGRYLCFGWSTATLEDNGSNRMDYAGRLFCRKGKK